LYVTNRQVAAALEETASLLEIQGANPFRVAAYRNAATMIRQRAEPLEELYRTHGIEGLRTLPGIGTSLGAAIGQLLRMGHFSPLNRLRGDEDPERVFRSVANIGPQLARRIHESLGIETLAELEAAAHDGRLAEVPGMGTKRIRAVKESLAGRFRRLPPRSRRTPKKESISVAEILEVDEEYRKLAQANRLRKIAPRRFNPTGAAWLPVLHTQRGDRHYTALYSNTARAHELGVTHDWVVIYRDDHEDGQWTVITAKLGKLRGKRIIRGRESECAAHYAMETS
jgi:DNA polymerase/3'-5' exonuclease PolX